jgi:hypothetical protein
MANSFHTKVLLKLFNSSSRYSTLGSLKIVFILNTERLNENFKFFSSRFHGFFVDVRDNYNITVVNPKLGQKSCKTVMRINYCINNRGTIFLRYSIYLYISSFFNDVSNSDVSVIANNRVFRECGRGQLQLDFR